jgi:hypothetical protein
MALATSRRKGSRIFDDLASMTRVPAVVKRYPRGVIVIMSIIGGLLPSQAIRLARQLTLATETRTATDGSI